MAVSTINKGYTKDMGNTEGIICPNCKKPVSMRLFTTTDTSVVTKITKIDGDVHIAVCPLCACVFSLSKNYMKERSNGTTVFITESDLTVLVNGK